MNMEPSRRDRPVAEPRHLYRSRRQRMLAGVAGGIGAYFNVDPTIVRVVMVLAAVIMLPVTLPVMLVLYAALAFVIPPEPEVEQERERGRETAA